MSKQNVAPVIRMTAGRPLSVAELGILARSADQFIARCLAKTTGRTRCKSRALEQFYTNGPVVEELMAFADLFTNLSDYLVIEPSAGNGAFSRNLPAGSIAIDVDPKCPGIIKADFLCVKIDSAGHLAVIGNPPFSAAVPFFNHAASQARIIALVLPRTFKKDSTLRRIDPRFVLVAECDVPPNAFLREGKPYNIPAVFQIWVRKKTLRRIPERKTTHAHFSFCKAECADWAIQRVGAYAGRIHQDFERSDQAHLFIRVRDRRRVRAVRKVFDGLDLAGVARNTAGNPSISRSEIVALYSEAVARQPQSQAAAGKMRISPSAARSTTHRAAPGRVNPITVALDPNP